jgi:two-component system sensor histidine kinase EvgS
MNAILGYSEILGNLIKDKKQIHFLDSIRSSGKSLISLINDILDLSKIEAEKLELHFEYVDSAFFFSEFRKIFGLKLSEKGLDFILDISPDMPQGIYIDELRLRQVLFNLIGNSVKFTEKGYVRLKIATENQQVIRISEDKDETYFDLVIEVEDTGIGISDEFRKELYAPFTQQHNQSTKKYGGTGLGLAITRRLVELMNGSIQYESEPERGTTFSIKIKDVVYLKNFENRVNEAVINPIEIMFEKAVILVADDIESNRSYIKDLLENSNLIIVEAENGQDAYDLAIDIVPDLIIADIQMPVMDGFELLKKLKANELLKQIPVIAYSASVMKERKEQILNSEFAGLLIKPVQIREIYSELIKHLAYRNEKLANPSTQEIPDGKYDAIIDLDELKNLLLTQYTDTWKTFKDRQPLNQITDFGKQLLALGKKHNAELLAEYSNALLTAADTFDIEGIIRLIKQYPQLIQRF